MSTSSSIHTSDGRTVVGRLAPSPSGRMHIGNLFSFLVAYLDAHQRNGYVVLRIDDLDQARSKQEFIDALFDDLRWFGFSWEGEVYFQSERSDVYRQAFEKLQKQGLVYPCFCSRAELHALNAPHAGDELLYPGNCKHLSEMQRQKRSQSVIPSYRVKVPNEPIEIDDEFQGKASFCLPKICGDFIVKRKDSAYAYQLATVLDDYAMGVTHVVRGVDLFSSAPRQRFLQERLNLPEVQYGHIPLFVDRQGRRLAKRNADASLEYLRDIAGWGPEKILGFVAHKAGLIGSNEAATLKDLIAEANLAKLKGITQLTWDNNVIGY